MYILGAVVLAYFYFKQREPLAIESAVKSFCSKDRYLWISWDLCRIASAKHRCHAGICIVWRSNPF